MSDTELLARCTTVLPGHRARRPAEMFSAMAAWCEAKGIQHDVYGEGAVVQDFERKVAELLGFEAAVFCISGTMTQVTALRLAAMDRGMAPVALHPTSHIFVHEQSNYQLLNHFAALSVGERHRPWTAADITGIPERLSAVGLEIPMREIGGQLSSWDELQAIKAHCRAKGIHLHMDGARLWEAAAGYARPLAEIAAGFDSVYVSLYKGIGGVGGAMLLGTREFVARAAKWFARQGGKLVHQSPYVVAAAMQFDARLASMPALFERTRFVYEVLAEHPVLKLNPAAPQANMLHVHLPVGRERALEIRRKLAAEHGLWIFHRISHGVLPDTSYFELYVGDNLLEAPDGRVREAAALLAAEVQAAIG
ncbi:low specificity L-threonine aldolase [Massilia sp. 2TAF26]|uniref:threonine aldolase family protein n=1 Tax=Massilia sp. 2TAF26 TaxID=3233012 RepID=UPI003F964D13